VTAEVVPPALESVVVTDFLDSVSERVSGLLIEGEAGIGKTTRWLDTTNRARLQGFRILTARAGVEEVALTFAALADLLGDVDAAILAELPTMHRVAVDRVLSRSGEGPPTDEHVLGAAFVSIVQRLAADAPVLLAVDDLQWLDSSSQAVLAYAIRRLTGRIGVLGTVRTDPAHPEAGAWVQLARPDGLRRTSVAPLTLGGIRKVVSARLGRSLPRPVMVRIAEISGGNPFYALELARAVDVESSTQDVTLPATLTALVQNRIGLLEPDVREVLLVAAATAAPTVELLAQVCRVSIERVMELLEEVETKGIIAIVGNRVRFSHPLLATGVYSAATPVRGPTPHRKLAEVIEQPELKARHLALAATSADAVTLAALDAAADVAVARGAPLAAVELIDLAIGLGGDNPGREIRAAELLFRAGAIEQARARVEPVIRRLESGTLRSIALILLGAVCCYSDSFDDAVEVLTAAVNDTADIPALGHSVCQRR
jgi:hypothetical protein